MNFCDARNSASFAPPSPSSLTICPACFGGRGENSATSVPEPSKPTLSASMPASASDSVVSGFFLAAMIPLNDGYRGSLIFSTTDTTAGVGASTTSYPVSVSRSIFTVPSPTSTLRAKVSWAAPSRSASIAGTTLIRASVDSTPRMTRSWSIVASAFASAYDVARASDPWRAGSTTWTALSAPMDSALRMVSTALSGPMLKTVTSPLPCASLIFSASSTAYSSSSFMTPSTLARSTVLSSELSFFSAHVSGTCFTQTTMFMAGGRPPWVGSAPMLRGSRNPLFVRVQGQHHVAAIGDLRVVGGEHQRAVTVWDLEQPGEHELTGGLVLLRGRLVGNQDLRAQGQRPSYGHPLLLPAGELLDELVLMPRESHGVERLRRGVADLLDRPARRAQGSLDVLRRRQQGDQSIALEDNRDLSRVRAGIDQAAVDAHLAGVGLSQAGEQREQA